MTDTEKTIKGLMHCTAGYCNQHCPYYKNLDCRVDMEKDALKLLREKKAKKPNVSSDGVCCCAKCGETVGYYPAGCKTPNKLYKFCHECGQEVKWE